MDRHVLGSDTERVKLEGNLKHNNFYSESLMLWTYSRYRLQQVSPHNRDVRPNIPYTYKCVSKLNTQHSLLRTYIQGILPTYYSTIPCHAPHTLPPNTHNPHPLSSYPHFSPFSPHTHNPHPPSSRPPPTLSLLTHTSHLPFSHMHPSTPLPPHLHSSSRRYRRPVGFLRSAQDRQSCQ